MSVYLSNCEETVENEFEICKRMTWISLQKYSHKHSEQIVKDGGEDALVPGLSVVESLAFHLYACLLM